MSTVTQAAQILKHLRMKLGQQTHKKLPTCSVLAVGPHQILALGHNDCEALCCRQIAERQQDLPDCVHGLWIHTQFPVRSTSTVKQMSPPEQPSGVGGVCAATGDQT